MLCCGAMLIAFRFYWPRHTIAVHALSKTVLAGIFVPLIEEPLVRGLILGLLLRTGWRKMSILVTSAFFAAAIGCDRETRLYESPRSLAIAATSAAAFLMSIFRLRQKREG